MKIFLLLSLLVFFSSCGLDSTANSSPLLNYISSSEYSSIDSIKISKSSKKISWGKDWSFALAEVLSTPDFNQVLDIEIAKTDLDLVGCSNYNQLSSIEKKIFLIIFISAISEAESDFQIANETYNPGDSTMNIGLLQIDIASAKRHSGVKYSIKSNEDLKNPSINLKVGAHIFKNQIVKSKHKGRLFPAQTYYWQVLSGSKVRLMKNINLNRENISFCN